LHTTIGISPFDRFPLSLLFSFQPLPPAELEYVDTEQLLFHFLAAIVYCESVPGGGWVKGTLQGAPYNKRSDCFRTARCKMSLVSSFEIL
jgi:hypothetical protein